VTVQYCMAYARMVLQSLEIPAVSQFRAGDDYGPGQSTGCSFPYCVYNIGTTSLIAWALGLAPAKDDFWSTQHQPGNPYSHGNATEPYSEMEAAIASYSTGPVQPSDMVGAMNASLLLMTCASDGTLLQPSLPASAIDATFVYAAFGTPGTPKPTKHDNPAVWSTHTVVGGKKYAHVLVIGLNNTMSLTPADILLDIDTDGEYVAYTGYGAPLNVSINGPFSGNSPIVLAPCLYSNFRLWHAAPRSAATGWALLGEMGKWVPIAKQRVLSVADSGSGIAATVAGAPGETAVLTFADKDSTLHTATCVFPSSDATTWVNATASCSASKCECA